MPLSDTKSLDGMGYRANPLEGHLPGSPRSCAGGQAGFTFIEAITVAVIVAILAAVAIPSYNSYVEQQKVAVVTNMARAASVTLGSYFRRNGPPPEGDIALKALITLPNPGNYVISTGPEGAATWVKVHEDLHPEITSPEIPFR